MLFLFLFSVLGCVFQKRANQSSGHRDGSHARCRSGLEIWHTVRYKAVLLMSGSVAGLLTGLLGIGGGFVIVPALQRYTNLVMQSIISTSLAVIALVSMTGVVSSVLAGSLNWVIAIPFCAGALSGIIGGRLISS